MIGPDIPSHFHGKAFVCAICIYLCGMVIAGAWIGEHL